MKKKAMKLVDPVTGEMVCEICGTKHWASISPNSNGKYKRGSWQCENGCQPDPKNYEDVSKKGNQVN